MSLDSAAVEQAFHKFLAARGLNLNELNLGNAFKVMLEFQRDVKFAWADPDLDAISLEWYELGSADSSSGGFLGLFKTVTKGKLTGYQMLVCRTLEPLDEDSSNLVILSVDFEYAVTKPRIAGYWDHDQLINQLDFDSVEKFVTSTLELNFFKALALERPRSVAVTL